ncbi:MAG: hypothetical protein QOG10_6865 [Kribbellaceae bacterium]|nr:hypothetical protein [Kribbellaceae bacterium]
MVGSRVDPRRRLRPVARDDGVLRGSAQAPGVERLTPEGLVHNGCASRLDGEPSAARRAGDVGGLAVEDSGKAGPALAGVEEGACREGDPAPLTQGDAPATSTWARVAWRSWAHLDSPQSIFPRWMLVGTTTAGAWIRFTPSSNSLKAFGSVSKFSM